MVEKETTKITQQKDGRYPVGSRKHRQLVLKTMKVCAKSGDVRMLGKYLAKTDKLLQSSRRSHTLERIHAFFLEGQAFENKHGIGAAMDLEDPLVR
ncbi:hypothetical protein ACFSOZ_24305 [Mesorhizobium newzealandense]|uniref:Transposase n=1 Tax=Mesorhizobium newzealandense TaxID=1300302 RepID=A0ABW4UEL4_9HYPH